MADGIEVAGGKICRHNGETEHHAVNPDMFLLDLATFASSRIGPLKD